jgi:diphthamide biosynthesis protein 3
MDDDEPTIYDEIEIEDMTYDATTQMYHYPCPCGDKFEIALVDLLDEADIAVCPSCSLMVRVIFEVVSFPWILRLPRGFFGGGQLVVVRLTGQ